MPTGRPAGDACARWLRNVARHGTPVRLLYRLGRVTLPGLGLFALCACTTAPAGDPLVGLHDQAVSLGRPSLHEDGAFVKVRAEPEISESQNSR